MRIKKKLFLLVFFNFILVEGQSILNALSPEIYIESQKWAKEEDLPPFLPIEEKDLDFSKTIYEIIDLNEKTNQVYFYDSKEIGNSCKSLYHVLLEGIKNHQIKAYKEDDFIEELDLSSLQKRLKKEEISEIGKEIFNQGKVLEAQYYNHYEIRSSEVKKFKIKGIWYFDRRIGEIKYRILALAPLGPDIYQMGGELQETLEEVELFWIWYFGARKLLDKAKICSEFLSIKPSFEELLSARRFSSLIYKENLNQNDFSSKREKSKEIKEEMDQKIAKIWNP